MVRNAFLSLCEDRRISAILNILIQTQSSLDPYFRTLNKALLADVSNVSVVIWPLEFSCNCCAKVTGIQLQRTFSINYSNCLYYSTCI